MKEIVRVSFKSVHFLLMNNLAVRWNLLHYTVLHLKIKSELIRNFRKLHNFFDTQILREIKSRVSKFAIFYEMLRIVYLLFLPFFNFHAVYQISRAPKIANNGNFRTSKFSKIDLTQDLSDRKIMNFPNCDMYCM